MVIRTVALIFPVSKNVVRDPFDPVQRIDREVADRSRRLALGLSLEDDLNTVTGALVVTEGKGRYLRVLHAASCFRVLPEMATQILAEMVGGGNPSFLDIRAVQSDLAIAQFSIAEELQRHAGKYVDRLLFISISDPGICVDEDDVNRLYMPICDPDLLAEATGISVIDAFPLRDISSGGSGQGLNAFPAWLLFADRSAKTASIGRLLILIGETTTAYYLPASDGLDVDIPPIETFSGRGVREFRHFLDEKPGRAIGPDVQQLNVGGNQISELAQLLEADSADRLKEATRSGTARLPDCIRTLVVSITDEISAKVQQRVTPNADVQEIIVDCSPELLGTFLNQFRRRWSNADFFTNCFENDCVGSLNSVLAAVLGMMSIDQIPANLPHITGAQTQRILGRFTPGAPSNWRQLLREMADFQPPAMRLRDAV